LCLWPNEDGRKEVTPMRTFLRTTFLLTVPLVLSAFADAMDYVKLKNGTEVKGEAVSFDDATQTLRLKLDELDKRSVYLVNYSKVPKDDAAKQIRIGNLARDTELFARALQHYGLAEKADPSKKADIDAERAKLRQQAAAFGMRLAKAELAKGNKAEAEKWLVKIVEKVPDEPQAAEAQAMLEESYSKVRAEKEATASAKASDQLKKDLQPGKKAYDSMVDKTKKGLTAKSSSGTATSSWEGALTDGKKVVSELDKLEKKYPDASTRETLAGYRAIVEKQIIEVHMHLASVWTTRSSYNKALDECNKALAIDPQNETALATRARVEQAASERGWIW
jgi:tetratricopeptide (TPR) repeat protein